MQKRRNAVLVTIALLLACWAIWFFVSRREPATPPAPSAAASVTAQAPETAPPAPSASTELATADAEAAEPEASAANTRAIAAAPRTADTPANAADTATATTPAASSTAAFALPEAGPPDAALAAAISAAPPPPSKPTIGTLAADFHDRVGVTFRLLSVSCKLDGVSACNKSGGGRDFSLFSQKVAAGSHTLLVIASYQGASGGVFSYAEGYHFAVQNSAKLAVNADQTLHASVLVRESGGPTIPMEQRLKMGISLK